VIACLKSLTESTGWTGGFGQVTGVN
jgi:hypothetical protein